MARSFTPELGIRIRFSDHKADWWGTRAQLEAEGFIPEGTLWPNGKRGPRVETDTALLCIHRVGNETTDPTAQTLYHVHHYSRKHDDRERKIAKKLREALDIAAMGGKEWTTAHHKYCEARRDDAFQEFKNKLLGLKKRGRPAKAATTQTQGAAA